MSRTMPRGVAALLAAAAVLALPACDGGHPLAPFEPEVSIAADNFQFQATGLTGVTLTRDYSWQNTAAKAAVNQATQLTGGSAMPQVLACSPRRSGTSPRNACSLARGSAGRWSR